VSAKTLRFDPAATDKLRFVAIALPVFGALGGVLRALGRSDQVLLLFTIPLFIVVFLVWRFSMAVRVHRAAADAAERDFFQQREAQLRERLGRLVEAQQAELSELRRRQRTEQERLLQEQASREQLAVMMERHRSEYESILSRRTA